MKNTLKQKKQKIPFPLATKLIYNLLYPHYFAILPLEFPNSTSSRSSSQMLWQMFAL
jgi:hypothetical protein